MTRSVLSNESGAHEGSSSRYRAPGWLTTRVMNPAVTRLTRWGLPLAGSRVLAVRGRSSGQWRCTPVNPLVVGGERYLVAPRGTTQWVRNLRAAGGGELRAGRRVEAFSAVQLDVSADGDEVVAVLREYLRRWAWEVGAFFDGVGAGSSDEELLGVAPRHPVFRTSPR